MTNRLGDWLEYGKVDPVSRMKSEFRRQFAAMRGHIPTIWRAGEYRQCHAQFQSLEKQAWENFEF